MNANNQESEDAVCDHNEDLDQSAEYESTQSYRRYRAVGGLFSLASYIEAVAQLTWLKNNPFHPWRNRVQPEQRFKEIIPGSILAKLYYKLRGQNSPPDFDSNNQRPKGSFAPFQLSDSVLAEQARMVCLLN